jgi:penicillin-binding protein 1A
VFADAGQYHPWRSYYRVLSEDGRILLSTPDRSEIVLSAGNAAIMTKLLQGVVEYGTSSSVTLGKRVACAGKTGTTNNDGDRWFIGYTPDYLCGVWCGYEYPEPLVGKNLCTGIWNGVMKQIVDGKGGRSDFEIPSNVVRVEFCRDSGDLPSEACAFDARGVRRQVGWFVLGTEPKTSCDRHVLCAYDAAHGGIDHGHCPQDALEKVSLVRVERAFPMQITITDAQYTWGGDPHTVLPCDDPTRPYFSSLQSVYTGRSATRSPFNRSCTAHSSRIDHTDDWRYPIPQEEEHENE